MLADPDEFVRYKDLYEVLKGYASVMEVRYLIDESMKKTPVAAAPPPPAAPAERSKWAGEKEREEWMTLLIRSRVEEEVRDLLKKSFLPPAQDARPSLPPRVPPASTRHAVSAADAAALNELRSRMGILEEELQRVVERADRSDRQTRLVVSALAGHCRPSRRKRSTYNPGEEDSSLCASDADDAALAAVWEEALKREDAEEIRQLLDLWVLETMSRMDGGHPGAHTGSSLPLVAAPPSWDEGSRELGFSKRIATHVDEGTQTEKITVSPARRPIDCGDAYSASQESLRSSVEARQRSETPPPYEFSAVEKDWTAVHAPLEMGLDVTDVPPGALDRVFDALQSSSKSQSNSFYSMLRGRGGVRVLAVDPRGTAGDAGILPGDVILEVLGLCVVESSSVLRWAVQRVGEMREGRRGAAMALLLYRPLTPSLLRVVLQWT